MCSPNLGVVVGMELDVGMHTISTSKGHSEPVGCPSLGHGYEPHSLHLSQMCTQLNLHRRCTLCRTTCGMTAHYACKLSTTYP